MEDRRPWGQKTWGDKRQGTGQETWDRRRGREEETWRAEDLGGAGDMEGSGNMGERRQEEEKTYCGMDLEIYV